MESRAIARRRLLEEGGYPRQAFHPGYPAAIARGPRRPSQLGCAREVERPGRSRIVEEAVGAVLEVLAHGGSSGGDDAESHGHGFEEGHADAFRDAGGEEDVRGCEDAPVFRGVAEPGGELDVPCGELGLSDGRREVAVHVRCPVQVHALEGGAARERLHEKPVYRSRAGPEEAAEASRPVGAGKVRRVGIVAQAPGLESVGDEETLEGGGKAEDLELPVARPESLVEGGVVVHRHEDHAVRPEGLELFRVVAVLPDHDEVALALRQLGPGFLVGNHVHGPEGVAEQRDEEVRGPGLCEVEGVGEESDIHKRASHFSIRIIPYSPNYVVKPQQESPQFERN